MRTSQEAGEMVEVEASLRIEIAAVHGTHHPLNLQNPKYRPAFAVAVSAKEPRLELSCPDKSKFSRFESDGQ